MQARDSLSASGGSDYRDGGHNVSWHEMGWATVSRMRSADQRWLIRSYRKQAMIIDRGERDVEGLLDDLGLGQGIRRLLPDDANLLPFVLKDVPGEAGLRLRARWYEPLFGALGEGCGIGPGVTFVHPEQIFLGKGVRLAGNLHLEVPGGQGRIELADGVYLGWGSYVTTSVPGGHVRIGERTWICSGAHIWGEEGGVEIGAQCPIASGLLVMAYQHEFGDVGRPILEQGGTSGTVIVEDDVYLGLGVRLLTGVTVGRGTVVGAGAVVTRSLPPYVVAAGVPARVLHPRGATGSDVLGRTEA